MAKSDKEKLKKFVEDYTVLNNERIALVLIIETLLNEYAKSEPDKVKISQAKRTYLKIIGKL